MEYVGVGIDSLLARVTLGCRFIIDVDTGDSLAIWRVSNGFEPLGFGRWAEVIAGAMTLRSVLVLAASVIDLELTLDCKGRPSTLESSFELVSEGEVGVEVAAAEEA